MEEEKCARCASPVGIEVASRILGMSKRWIYAAYADPENVNLPKKLSFPGKWLWDIKDLEKWKEENKR